MALRITVLLVGLLLLANSGADGAPGDAVGQTGASKERKDLPADADRIEPTTLWSDVTTAITTGTAEDETWMDTLCLDTEKWYCIPCRLVVRRRESFLSPAAS